MADTEGDGIEVKRRCRGVKIIPRLFPNVAGVRREIRMAGYAAGNFGKNIVWSSADLTLLFVLTDLLHLPPMLAGSFMLIGTLSDLVFDVLITALIGKAVAAGVEYRVFLVVGAPVCGLFFTLLYALPTMAPVSPVLVLATLLLFRASFAILDVPHNTLLALIATDSRSRGRTSGYRYFFSSLGGIYTALTFARIAIDRSSGAALDRLASLAALTAVLLIATVSAAALASGKPSGAAVPRDLRVRWRSVLLPHFDRMFLAIAVLALLIGFAMPMFGRMLVYFSTYVLDRPGLMRDVLLMLGAAQILGVILWTALVQWWSKPRLLGVSFATAFAGLVLIVALGTRESVMLPIAALLGVGLAGVYMLPWGIVADIIDVSQFRHGERREIATIGAFLLLIKISSALAAALIGGVLQSTGYIAGAVQSEPVRQAIVVLFLGVPLTGAALGALLGWRLSLDHRTHARVLVALSNRAARSHRPR